MSAGHPGQRLTVYCGEYDRHQHRPLARALLERAREEGLAGATLVRGIEGFGASSRLHTARFVTGSDDLPIVIEFIDRADRIRAFLPVVEAMVTDGLVTVEDLEVVVAQGPPEHLLDDDAPPA